MHAAAPSSRRTHRLTLAAYVATMAIVCLLLPAQELGRPTSAYAALALFAIVGIALATRRNAPPGSALTLASILLFLLGVALLRHGAGGSAGGFGPLVLMPVIWAALRGRRLEVAVAVAGAAAVFAIPQLLIGPPTYGPAGWRTGSLLVAMSAILGFRVADLVRALRAETDRAAAVVDAMSEGFALTRDGAIVAVNPALCAMTGLPDERLLGARPPYPFWPPEGVGDTEALRRRIVADDGGEFELTLMHADGTRFPASITATRVDLGDGRRTFLNTIRDITQLKAHEQSMLRRAEDLAAMAEVTRVVGHSTPQDARRTICQVATDVAGAATAMIWEAGDDGALHNTCALGAPEPGFVLGEAERENGACVAWRTGHPLFVADVTTSPRCDPRLIELIGARSAHFQPIPGRDGIRGALTISWREPVDAVPAHAALLLEVLAGEAAVALERDDLLRQLSDLSRTDELTGLPNRRAWDELLDRELRVARRTGQPVTVAMLDLDHFKAYNDLRGHLAGDRLLRSGASLWQSRLRETDVLARWGGEEFALLLPGCDAACATGLIERLRGLLPDGVTFSAGVAPAQDGRTADEIVAAADAALYAAKEAGRDRVELASPAPSASVTPLR